MAQKSIEDELCDASAKGNLIEVMLCLERGAAINGLNSYNRTALQVVMLGNSALVAALLCAGANHTLRDGVCGLTVIHDAAREGFEETVRVLLEYGADANVKDDRGNLPLHLAAIKGHASVVKLLFEHTALHQSRNDEGPARCN
ncbi:cyclin-dependent kinase 4 inhibitor C [Eucyclogobius newberryi]|uniref:cyclin-dependent kinase 4 inhibitor C n=1 Tax=Eucyclogobius newberryi TaxID=166745 RepID=UPI003B5A947F